MNVPVLITRKISQFIRNNNWQLTLLLILNSGFFLPVDLEAKSVNVPLAATHMEDCTEEDISLTCIGWVQVSVNMDGYGVLTPSTFVLAGDISNAIIKVNDVIRDTVFCSDIGAHLTVEVFDSVTTQSCWSTLIVEDKLAPTITCDTVRFSCTQDPFDPNLMLMPTDVSDNCGTPGLTFNDSPYMSIDCDEGSDYTGKFIRTWTATDASGRSATCDQIVLFERLPLDSVDCPADNIQYCPTFDHDPSVTGRPDYNGEPLSAQCGIVSWHDDTPPGELCKGQFKIVRTWTIMDWCTGEMTMCDQELMVLDTTGPVIDCPDDIELSTDHDACSLDFTLPEISAYDACSMDMISYSIMIDTKVGTFIAGDMVTLDTGMHVLTYTVRDDCGNPSVCSYKITVVDDLDPEISCNPQMVVLGNGGTTMLTFPNFDVTVSDNCGVDSVAVRRLVDNCSHPEDLIFGTKLNFCCADIGTDVMVEYIVFDHAGNSNSTMCAITVKDPIPPIITCPEDITVNTDPGICGSELNIPNVDAIDNCGTPVVTNDAPDIFPIGCTTVIFTATDASNNTDTCHWRVCVIDELRPMIFCPSDTIIECNTSTDPDVLGMATATDNCGTPRVTFNDVVTPGTCPQMMTITRTWTAADMSGNTVECIQTIIIEDRTAPVITFCPPNLSLECGMSTDPADTGTATAMDNCDGATVTFRDNRVVGSCPQMITLTRTWFVEDACENIDSCIQIITLNDTQAPDISCPDNVTIACGESTLPINTGMATATDDCNGATITSRDTQTTGSCAQELIISRTWYAEDGCGNIDSCIQIITSRDTVAPIITCPANAEIDCDDQLPTEMATATDACAPDADIMITSAIIPGNMNGTLRRWYAMDPCGNIDSCDQMITVSDNTPPNIVCPNDVTVECNESTEIADLGSATATDVCDMTPTISSVDMINRGDCPQESVITRRWYAQDDSGNIDSCDQVITVQDNTAPVISCPINVTLDCNQSTSIEDLGSATANDLCDMTPTVTSLDMSAVGTCPQEMVITRRWYAEDDCGNIDSCDQLISLIDTIAPEITCPSDATINCDDDVPVEMATATDICANEMDINISSIILPGGMANEMIRRWYATDPCGNVDSCDQMIVIQDNTPPDITCPADVTLDCDESTTIADRGSATAVDVCDLSPTISSADMVAPGRCAQEMVITRRWYAEDDFGNIDSCDQTISLIDDNAPVIVCPADVTIGCNDPLPSQVATATDACAPQIDIVITSAIIADGFEDGVLRRWYATDPCGNRDSCDQEITTVGMPSIVCPADITLDCDFMLSDLDNLPGATATESCTGMNVPVMVQVINNLDPTCNTGTIERIFTASFDGFQDMCTQTITVGDSNPFGMSNIQCPDAIVNVDDNCGNADVSPATLMSMPTLVDTAGLNCFDVTINFNDVEVANTPFCMEWLRTWTITNSCGGVFNCVQNIRVNGTAPTLNAMDTIKDFATDMTCNVFVNIPVPTTDCMNDVITHNSPFADNPGNNASGTYPGGVTTVVFTAVNACGITSTDTTVVNICDTIPPQITCIKSLLVVPPTGEVDVPISIFFEHDDQFNLPDSFPTDNCSADANIIATYDPLNPADTVRTYNCADQGENSIILYAIDEAGNIASCSAIIDINDINGNCMNRVIAIGGTARTEYGDELPHAKVHMMNQVMEPVLTDENGRYAFNDLELNGDYEFAPERDGDFSNGLSTLDMIGIVRHVLGIRALESPYQQIAADVDGNNNVNLLDVLKLQQVILYGHDEIRENTSWRFVDRAYEFNNSSNALSEAFPESMRYNPIIQNQMNADFVAIKVGDVNGTASPDLNPINRVGGVNIDFVYEMDEEGDIIFTSTKDITVDGYQLSVRLPDGAKEKYDVSILNSDSRIQNYTWKDAETLIFTVVNIESNYIDKNEALFKLIQKEGVYRQSEFKVSILDDLRPEVYTGGQIAHINLRSKNDVKGAFELHQNVPNPFTKSTIVRFVMPDDNVVIMNLYDINGAKIRTIDYNGRAGMNEMTISGELLSSGGIYYYELISEDFRAVKKLVFTP